jgi:holliday junction resolvase Hjr
MSRKSKGINAERELIRLFWDNGWAAIRVAGSGSMRHPSSDILASNTIRRLAIECKASKDTSKYLGKDEILQLKTFSQLFGAEPWIAVRFDRADWLFLTLEDIKDTGQNFCITLDSAKKKGLLFEELLEQDTTCAR